MTAFLAEWAPGEPRDMPNVNCAYLSKTDGYKMKTDMCTIPRKYICMALSPNCPPGYQWISLFGEGRSCFKATGLTFTLRVQSFSTLLKADLRQDMKGGFAFGWCLNGTFP